MYCETDLQSIQMRIKKRRILILVPVLVLLILFVFIFVQHLNRNDSLLWLANVAALLIAAILIFCNGMFMAPLRAYRRFLKDALHGRTRELKGVFKSLDSTPCMRDNVAFYSLIISEGDLSNEEDERLFYFDVLKPFPNLAVGDAVTVVSTDKRVADILI